jgi:hypothetical protein
LPFAFCLASLRADAPPIALYVNNFDALPEGPPPADILTLNGEFTIVKVKEGDNALQLAGDPLDTMGALLGPADRNEYAVAARIQTASTGRRFPEFGVGACGPGQFKLWLMPAVGELQLIKGDDVLVKAPYAWKSGDWTRFKLQVAKPADGFKIVGKAWREGEAEPKEWMVSAEDKEAPPAGRACLLCTPYSGKATLFDDVVVTPVGR